MQTGEQQSFHGTITAIVTPFTDSGELDVPSLESLIEYQLDAGVAGIVACGSTGEASTLNDEEYRRVVETCVSATKGRALCLGGIGVSATARAAEMARYLERAGVDGILLSSPPYNKPTQDGLVAHFREVKKAAALPIVAYNIPGRTGVNIQPATIAKLAAEGTVAALKDATGSVDQLLDLLSIAPERLEVLSGEDSLVHPLMACGGKGVISATANLIPRLFVRMTSAAADGRWEESRRAQIEALPVVRSMFLETNPIPVKAALRLRNLIRSAKVRLPLTQASASTVARLEELLSGDSKIE